MGLDNDQTKRQNLFTMEACFGKETGYQKDLNLYEVVMPLPRTQAFMLPSLSPQTTNTFSIPRFDAPDS
jgi:hypothetical protein